MLGAAEGVGARLKLSNNDRKRLVQASAGPGDEGARALGYRVGIESAVDRLLLAGEDTRDVIDWDRPTLPIGGPCQIPTHCTQGNAKAPCAGNSDEERNRSCDSNPGAGDGFCDACPLVGGVTTEDEMFILLGNYFVP